jgi:hypothetical protein
VPLTHPTEETEFGLLPTPLAQAREQKSFDKYDERMERLIQKGHKPFTMPLDQMALRGLLPTPQASDFVSTVQEKNYSLRHLEHNSGWTNKMLPTPNSRDYKDAQTPEKYQARKEIWAEKGINLQLSLPQLINNQMIPTPRTRDWKGCEGRRGDIPSFIEDNLGLKTGKTSQLSPQFVMEMMGFPTDWTLLPFLNGETNQSKLEEMQ